MLQLEARQGCTIFASHRGVGQHRVPVGPKAIRTIGDPTRHEASEEDHRRELAVGHAVRLAPEDLPKSQA